MPSSKDSVFLAGLLRWLLSAFTTGCFVAACGGSGGGGSTGAGGSGSASTGASESILHSFGATGDGEYPLASLIHASDGNFYGTTEYGGANGTGAVFKITAAGTETVLYSFGPATGTDGQAPEGLIQASDGNLYGTTKSGGANGTGTVFQIATSGTETRLYSFGPTAGTDGQHPSAALIQASDGNLNGTTGGGGTNGTGTVFRVTTAGAETVLYSFGPSTGTDGQTPSAALMQASDGNLYGTTGGGGTNGTGTVFRVTTSGAETVLYSFGPSNGTDGQFPLASLIQATDGNLYGTTEIGGTGGAGTVCQVTTSGTEAVVYSFGVTSQTDGQYPLAGLIQTSDGSFYGTTEIGGTSGAGTAFRID